MLGSSVSEFDVFNVFEKNTQQDIFVKRYNLYICDWKEVDVICVICIYLLDRSGGDLCDL